MSNLYPLATISVLLVVGADAQPMRINEFQYDPPAGHAEFVEVINTGDRLFDGALGLSDERLRVGETGTARVQPGEMLVLTADRGAFAAQFPGIDAVELHPWPALNNGGDTVVLWIDGVVADSVQYSTGWPGQDRSVERIHPLAPSAQRASWAGSLHPAGGTPGAQNSVFDAGTAPRVQFAGVLDARTIEVFFDVPVDPVLVGRFRVDDQLAFAEVDETGRRILLDHADAADANVVRVADVRGLTGLVAPDTAVAIAMLPGPGDLIFNELLPAPIQDAYDGRPDQPEFIEWFNRTPRPLSTRGMVLTRRLDEHGEADTTRLDDSRPVAVSPGEFLTVVSGTAAALLDAFPDAGWPVVPIRFSLPNAGDHLTLAGPAGIIDVLTYDASMHHPDVANPRGLSLERVHADAPPEQAGTWTTTVDPSGGTPGQPNSVRIVPSGSTSKAFIAQPDVLGRDGESMSFSYETGQHNPTIRHRRIDENGHLVRTHADAYRSAA
ncbi:MAG: hypothetical protein AAF752_15300, partial [Bacteroidota bacterium]